MDISPELAKYGAYGIAIAALLLLMYLIPKFLTAIQKMSDAHTRTMQEMEQNHQASNSALQAAIQANTEQTRQTYEYLKLRNGSMDKTLTNLADRVDKLTDKL